MITWLSLLKNQQKLSTDFLYWKCNRKYHKTSCTENTPYNITRFLQLKIHQNITDVLLLKTTNTKLFVLNLALIASHIIISDFLNQNYTGKYNRCTIAESPTKNITGLLEMNTVENQAPGLLISKILSHEEESWAFDELMFYAKVKILILNV